MLCPMMYFGSQWILSCKQIPDRLFSRFMMNHTVGMMYRVFVLDMHSSQSVVLCSSNHMPLWHPNMHDAW